MKNKDQIMGRIEKLVPCGEKLAEGAFLAMVGSPEFQRQQQWLGQGVLVINEALPSSHPFRRQAAAYLAGGGQLGIQGMLALLEGLGAEIKAGTFG